MMKTNDTLCWFCEKRASTETVHREFLEPETRQHEQVEVNRCKFCKLVIPAIWFVGLLFFVIIAAILLIILWIINAKFIDYRFESYGSMSSSGRSLLTAVSALLIAGVLGAYFALSNFLVTRVFSIVNLDIDDHPTLRELRRKGYAEIKKD